MKTIEKLKTKKISIEKERRVCGGNVYTYTEENSDGSVSYVTVNYFDTNMNGIYDSGDIVTRFERTIQRHDRLQ